MVSGLVATAVLLLALSDFANGFDCTFESTYPRQYVAYKTDHDLVLDGKLDDPAWEEVGWTEDFLDINTTTTPALRTRAKIRWDDEFLYVGAMLFDPHVWANISTTCHCLNASQDQVIFHDNDFEIFTDADGTTHYYKEFEINAANATWDLCLDKPYLNQGNENSTRVFGKHGWDMQPPLHSAVHVQGRLNDPNVPASYWSVEVALPLKGLAYNKTRAKVPPRDGDYWRINFSRVEHHVVVEDGRYIKKDSCQSCPVPGAPHEDNWVWQPIGVVDMHLPERWGMLQFSSSSPGTQPPIRNREWTLRSVAMAVYNAEYAFFADHGRYTDNVLDLIGYADEHILNGTCSENPPTVTVAGDHFNVTVGTGDLVARVRDDRYLTVDDYTTLIM